ncbi:uncharacterized protein PGTG_21714 [Puccinia graminis f. sp. tritici CRL 75-36-700-3]|uniref:Uncharacterized protein n=1 Tax=Puccinia graminis f. sp. tritici (strain CRL 75-36-700-3 / race SCCL) TaxID=418459 RepID=H6QS97_PUCGT|nr:uncharacterized protein PGTG_21714 [Puccinia graminis f. sp. tritici CRL 75-36-700-3]EHS63621.1 hypothetical protein PGTG_21714 [Puccinia graminis f. sp. tritici CRL 75-36-700-3]
MKLFLFLLGLLLSREAAAAPAPSPAKTVLYRLVVAKVPYALRTPWAGEALADVYVYPSIERSSIIFTDSLDTFRHPWILSSP